MKKLRTCFFFILLIGYCPVNYSQGLSIGLLNGISLSDIHGNYCSGKWKYKAGASESLFINYSINKIIGFQTGIDVTTLNYEHLPYLDISKVPNKSFLLSSAFYLPDLAFYDIVEKMDFTLLTIPAQVKLSIPSKPSVNLALGVFYSFIYDYSLYIFNGEEPSKNDFGYLFSTGLSYPLNESMDALLDIGYKTGQKSFLEYANYRHGLIDFRFGLSFTGLLQNKTIKSEERSDTLGNRLFIIHKGGINVSLNKFGNNSGSYSIYTGYSLGFSVYVTLSEKTFFLTGLSFENTGYSLRDSSDSFHRYHTSLEPAYYVDTKIGTDYINIPAQFGIRIGKTENIYLNTGAYVAIKLNARCNGEAFFESKDQDYYSLQKIRVYDDLGGLIKDNDFGWIFGGGITMPVLERYSLDLSLQYRIGFRDIFDEEYYINMNRYERGETIIRNRVLSLNVGLRIPVFK